MIGIFWLIIKVFPWPALIRLGEGLGELSFHLAKRRRTIAQKNIARCFPERSSGEQEALNKKHFRHLGAALFETGLCWWARDSQLAPLLKVEGLEHLHAARASQKGVILFLPHFTTMELTGRFLYFYQRFAVTYRPSKQALLESLWRRNRARFTTRLISGRDVRRMVRVLRNGEALWYSADQAGRPKRAVIAPFFNKPSFTLRAPCRLLEAGNAVLLPFFCYRLPENQGYCLKFFPPVDHIPGDDEVAQATHLNHLIEEMIRLAPAQYFWSHERFKYDERYLDAEGNLRAS